MATITIQDARRGHLRELLAYVEDASLTFSVRWAAWARFLEVRERYGGDVFDVVESDAALSRLNLQWCESFTGNAEPAPGHPAWNMRYTDAARRVSAATLAARGNTPDFKGKTKTGLTLRVNPLDALLILAVVLLIGVVIGSAL